MMPFAPELIGYWRPGFGMLYALAAEFVDIFRTLKVCRCSTRFFHNVHELSGIVQKRARTEVVLVVWLMLAVFHEQRLLKRLQKGAGLYVAVAVVNECTGLDIAVRIDVKVSSAAGYAAVAVFAIIPEIQSEQRLGLSERAHLMIHELTLLGADHEIRVGCIADRNISEKPCELAAHLNQ